MKHTINHRHTGAILFETELPEDTPSELAIKETLERANLARANLAGANLAGAYLDGANLDGANLDGAYLDGAKLGDKTLTGSRPVLMIGPIGSRSDYLMAYMTDGGIVLKAGCFTGAVDEFRAKLKQTHGENEHAREYAAALTMIEAHAAVWTTGN